MWISLSKNSGCCEDGSKSSGSIKCRDFFFLLVGKTISCSRRNRFHGKGNSWQIWKPLPMFAWRDQRITRLTLVKIGNIRCDFDRASSLIRGNKMRTRCNRGFYCRSYCLLNMFRASLCCSILQTGHITLSSTPDQQLENHSTKYHRQQPPYNIILLSSWWWA